MMGNEQVRHELFGCFNGSEYTTNSLAFLKEAGDIADRLGRRSYLVEHYVERALATLNITDAITVMEAGSTSARVLRSVVRMVVSGVEREEAAGHPFLATAERYVREYPLPGYAESTAIALYVLALSDVWLRAEVKEEVEELAAACDGPDEAPEVYERFRRQCNEALGEKESMASLEEHFMARCRPVTPLTLFVEAFVSEMNYSMTEKDEETGHSIFSRWLESGIGLYVE